jgi:uncharacterized membrane protein
LTASGRSHAGPLLRHERLRALERAVIVLVLFSLYCTALEVARMLYTGASRYDFLIWNLFLAWIPFVVASLLAWAMHRGLRPLGAALLGLVWLLFFPNAPYLITDFIHLRGPATAPLWYDVLLIASFASVGMLLGFLSLDRVQELVAASAGPVLGWLVATIALVVAAFGMFIGRFEARNSWDVIVEPAPLARDTWHQLTSPTAYPRTLGVTASYAVFLVLAYVVVRVAARTRHPATRHPQHDALHRLRGRSQHGPRRTSDTTDPEP